MTRLAQRTSRIDSSGIRKVFALAADMKNPCNLSIGQPHFDVFPEVKQAAIDSIQAGKNSYTQTIGIPELRSRLLAMYQERGWLDLGDLMITSGVSGGIQLSLMALLDEGDEIIVPDPYFVMYKHLVNFIGGRPVYLDTYPEFVPDPDRIASLITPRTKAILLNSPGNPTGVLTPPDVLEAIVAVADQHGLLLISDEIYESFLYDGEPCSAAQTYPNTLILSGFSKSSAMTGWRLGYAYGPKDLIAAMINIQMYSFVCAPSFAQHAGVAALGVDLTPVRDDYRRKRDLIYNGLKDHYTVSKPGGAFYIFPEAPGEDGDAFVRKAIEHELLVVPGSVFSERKTHFRISFAASDEVLERGIGILQNLASA